MLTLFLAEVAALPAVFAIGGSSGPYRPLEIDPAMTVVSPTVPFTPDAPTVCGRSGRPAPACRRRRP
ncbi:hypothetical protein [Streptomyces sp. x-80]|uniref:hypothetical protein n=1 Tax=Streptomyces sp. x-80 TaxID=2789282 RepID=UPI00397EC8CB